MRVVITNSASESLSPIFLHHLDYSQGVAGAFQYEIDRFIVEHLSSNPDAPRKAYPVEATPFVAGTYLMVLL